MTRSCAIVLLVWGSLGVACLPPATGDDASAPADAARVDATGPDAAVSDAVATDAALTEAAVPEAAVADVAAVDAAGADAAVADSGSTDAAVADAAADAAVADRAGADAGDVCEGATLCEQAARACEGDTLVICAPRYAGSSVACLAETRIDCAGRGQSCSADGEPTCLGAGPCPAARALSCDSGTLVDTTLVSRGVLDDYSCDPDSSAYSTFDGREALYLLTVDRATEVTVTATPLDGVLRAYQLFVLRADGQTCSGELACVAPPQDGYAAQQVQRFAAQAGETFYLSYDLKGNFLLDQTTGFELSITCQDPICGNGQLEVGEACDDDDTDPDDGCSTTCAVEADWVCATAEGQASVCHAVGCGDGVVDPGEACDDHNSAPLDGCSPGCAVEAGYRCFGEPSRCYAGGDTCADAIPLSPGSHVLDTGAFTDSGVDLACDVAGNGGRDVYFSVEVPARSLLSARLQADWYEAELFALAGCANLAASCQRQGDLDLFNPGTQPLQRLLLVDTSSFAASPASGAFTLELDLTEAAALAAGDSCENAVRLSTASLPRTVQGSTAGLHNLYARYFNAGTACTYFTSYPGMGGGPDQVYVVEVPAGRTLRASLTTSWSGSGDTDSVLVISPGTDVESACLAYGNEEGAARSVTNASSAAADYYVVVDGFGATHAGAFELQLGLVD